MKIEELENAPEWLVLAKTRNADVEVTGGGWVTWKSGDFLGGNFLGGDFRGGLMMPHCKWIYGQNTKGEIGCKTKTVEEWTEWFDGQEEYDTKRGTEEFKKIQACFEATKAFIKFMNN